MIKDRRRHVESPCVLEDPGTAGAQHCALAPGLLDEREILGQLIGARHGARLGGEVKRVADFHGSGDIGHFLREFLVDAAFDQQPRARHADLAGIPENAERRYLGRLIEIVRIGEDDVGRLPTEFQVDPLQI